MRGASIVFYAHLGFDAISTAAQETKNPPRDMPIGIPGSLLVCTLLYVAFAGVLTGIAPYTLLSTPKPVATALFVHGGPGDVTNPRSEHRVVAVLTATREPLVDAGLVDRPRRLCEGLQPPRFLAV